MTSPEPLFERAVVVAGVRKCGTTSIHDLLALHPGVCANSRLKEPQWLILPPDVIEEHREVVLAGYEDPQALCLDGSTFAFHSPRAIENIRRFIREPRVVVVVRDPARRAYSAFWHVHRKSLRVETRSFAEVLQSVEEAGGMLGEAEHAALVAAERDRRICPGNLDYSLLEKMYGGAFRPSIHDRFFQLRYFGESCYRQTLRAWRDALGDRLELVVFEDFVADPGAVLSRLWEFLHLPPLDQVPALQANISIDAMDPIAGLVKAVYGFRPARWAMAHVLGRSHDRIARRIRDALYRPVPRIPLQAEVRARALLEGEYDFWRVEAPEVRALWTNTP